MTNSVFLVFHILLLYHAQLGVVAIMKISSSSGGTLRSGAFSSVKNAIFRETPNILTPLSEKRQ